MSAVLKIVPTEKVCTGCGVSRVLSEYHKNKKGLFGLKAKCKDCCGKVYKDPRKNRKDRLPKLYGITYEDVKLAHSTQFGLCANRGCGCNISLEVKSGSKDRAVIDHCHKTGSFRALLCTGCNLLLGKIENDKNRILGLMEYEEKHRNNFNIN